MKVYIEYILIDNLVIDYLILSLTSWAFKLRQTKLRLFVASVIGAGATIGLSLLTLTPFSTLLLKLVLGIILVLIGIKIKSLKEFFGAYFGFLAFTFLLGGLSWAILMMFNLITTSAGMVGYDSAVPLGVILLGCVVFVKIISKLCLLIYKKRDCAPFIGEIEVFLDGKSTKITGFIDSGNRLFDHVTGLPIIVISTSSLKPIITQNLFDEFNKGSLMIKNRYKSHFVPFQTLSGQAKPMMVFCPDKVLFRFNGKTVESKVMVGLTHKGFSDAVAYDALLHPSMLT